MEIKLNFKFHQQPIQYSHEQPIGDKDKNLQKEIAKKKLDVNRHQFTLGSIWFKIGSIRTNHTTSKNLELTVE